VFRNKRAHEVRPIADAQALLEDIAPASVTEHEAGMFSKDRPYQVVVHQEKDPREGGEGKHGIMQPPRQAPVRPAPRQHGEHHDPQQQSDLYKGDPQQLTLTVPVP